ncbi:hypothetical protein Tco_1057747 [Tanacetum coccineum]|uniref:Uncharacterized protein n=1 Tax=Tanacetum coccineum TaxID=301880 RepID=A0ABQ5H699_9ASTR
MVVLRIDSLALLVCEVGRVVVMFFGGARLMNSGRGNDNGIKKVLFLLRGKLFFLVNEGILEGSSVLDDEFVHDKRHGMTNDLQVMRDKMSEDTQEEEDYKMDLQEEDESRVSSLTSNKAKDWQIIRSFRTRVILL